MILPFSAELWTSQSCTVVTNRVPCLTFTQLHKIMLSHTVLELDIFLTACPVLGEDSSFSFHRTQVNPKDKQFFLFKLSISTLA